MVKSTELLTATIFNIIFHITIAIELKKPEAVTRVVL